MIRQRQGSEGLTTILLSLAIGVLMLDRMIQLFLGPYLVEEFHLSPRQIGLLASVVAICWGGSSFIFGMVSDRLGRRRILIPAIIVFSLLSWISGLARTYEELLVARALLGLAEGPCWAIIMALMEESSSPERRGRNMGIVNSGGPLVGSAIGPIFATQIASAFGWREAFFLAGIPGLILALLIFVYVPEPGREPGSGTAGKSSLAADLRAIASYRILWACFLGAFCTATWFFSVSIFAPLYMTQVAGQLPTTAGFLLSATGLGGFVLVLFWPALSDKWGRKPVLVLLAVISAFQPLAMLITGLYDHQSLMATILFLTSAGTAMGTLVMVIIPSETVPMSLRATALGLILIAGEAMGGTIAPLAGAVLAENFGLAAALLLASGAAIVIMVIGIFIRETSPGKSKALAYDVQA